MTQNHRARLQNPTAEPTQAVSDEI
jgi:hypothetical protein